MASSEDETNSTEKETKSKKSNYRKIIDSDSSEDEKSEVKDPEGNTSTKDLKSNSSDDDDNNMTTNNDKTRESLDNSQELQVPIKSSKSKLYDSDTSDDEPQETPKKNDRRKGVPKKFNKKPKEKTQRKSAKAAMETIKDELNIKELSEKAKAERDREIKIPYHKPKQYSLKEFLARKTINKPTIPAAPEESKPTILKMKMNTEEIEKFAQKMREREQEAMEFFKSESEEEEGENSIQPIENKEPIEKELICETPKDSVEVQSTKETSEIFEKEQIEMNQEEEPIESKMIPEASQQDLTNKENVCIGIGSPKKELRELPALKTLEEISAKNGVIDLITGDIKPKELKGPDLLFNRYLKTISKPKQKDTICMNILSVEDGKIENQRVEVKLDKKLELDHNRPGFSHELLKEQLRNKVMQKRLEEVRKKSLMKPNVVELEPEDKCELEKVQETAKMESDDEDYDPNNDSDEIDSENEERIYQKEKRKEKCDFVDDEADVEEDVEISEDESSESSSESEQEETTERKKGRILKAFADSDDEVEAQPAQRMENPFPIESQQDSENFGQELSQESTQEDSQNVNTERTDFTFSHPSISQDVRTSHLNDLFDSERSQANNEDDLMALCSGQFMIPKTQSITPSQFEGLSDFKDLAEDSDDFVSQVPERNDPKKLSESIFESQINDENLEDPQGASESIEANPITEKNIIRKLLESSDDEESSKKEKPKSKKKKKKRKQVKLGFSDDESDLEQLREDFDDEILDEEEEAEQDIEENSEVLIDYDSEENEIEVKVTKKQKVKLANEYFEKEAELSESEWGSADEDEKGMDAYEADLADEQQFDQDKLREEIGRIHARKLMDDDLKNVKKIQDLLFENEENDGVGRERKFRWKNQNEGFTMDDENAMHGDNLENADNDDENEMMWRRMRHEREVLINEQSQKVEESISEEILLLDQNSQTVSCTNSSVLVKRKFQIIRTSSSSFGQLNNNGDKKESPFLIKNGKSTTNNSFLSRDAQTLKRIASFMSNKGDDEVTNLSSHGGNSMSFVPCEKPTNESKKRKSDGNQKDENVKKRKIESQGFLLLDKLH